MDNAPMTRLAIIAFALGCAALQLQPQLPGLAVAGLLPLGVWVAMQLRGRWRQAAWLLLGLASGFLYAAWRADLRLAESLPDLWQGRDVELLGRVQDLPETTANGVRFRFAQAGRGDIPVHLQLAWYGRPGEPPPRIAGGDCLQLTARLYPPHGNLNPGGFDYEAWLFERDIRATGHLVGRPAPVPDCAVSVRAGLDRLREAIRSHLTTALADRPYAGVVRALAVGDQEAIPPAQWTLFRQTGVTHLMSISGLHITLFSALVYAAVVAVWRRFPALALRLPASKAGVLLGFAAAAVYAALAGFGIPAQRTLYMLGGAAATVLLDRQVGASRLLAAALFAVLLLDPWAAFSPGFWLSFAAVAALLWAGNGRVRPLPAWRAWIVAQWAVTLALTPLLLALFHEVSLVSPLANAFAIPWISFVVVPLSLIAAILPWAFPATWAHAAVTLAMTGLEGLAALPQPVFHAAAPSWTALLAALLGAGLLLLPRGVPGRWLGAVLLLPLFFPHLPAPAAGHAWLTVLDVGQGEAVLVRTARHALLFDTGPRFASGEDAGNRNIAPYLWREGLNRLDGLVVSHDDIDHSGGALSLLTSHRPAWLLTSLAGLPRAGLSANGRAILTARPDAITCATGQSWTWDGVRFRVLHPPAHHYAHPGYPDNERSCVIRIEAGRHTALLTGDIERLAEANLRERRQPLAADVLVPPHHGSRSSSSPEFVQAVAAKTVVIPVGWRNRYGHPHPEVLARYRASGAQILRSDRDGAVTLHLGAAGVGLETTRSTEKRYWRN